MNKWRDHDALRRAERIEVVKSTASCIGATIGFFGLVFTLIFALVAIIKLAWGMF